MENLLRIAYTHVLRFDVFIECAEASKKVALISTEISAITTSKTFRMFFTPSSLF